MQITFDIDENSLSWPYYLSFVGQKAAHSPYVYHIVSRVLQSNPVYSIIELGTYHGALTMYLGMWGVRLDVPVYSFDIEPNLADGCVDVLDRLGVQTFAKDVLDPGVVQRIISLMDDKPTYLVIDGGDKPAEFKTYVPLIPVGSVVSVHDWGTEILPEDIRVDGVGYEQFEVADWRRFGANLATCVKISQE